MRTLLTFFKHSPRASLWLGLALAVVVGVTLVQPVLAAEQATCEEGKLALNVPFGRACVANLPEYIQNFYRYFVGAIGIFGVAMIMYAGIRWIASNGNSKEIEAAKDQINSAIFGVFLALTSYVLLNLINPMILDLRNPIAGKIDPASLSGFCQDILGAEWATKVNPAPTGNSVCGQTFKIIGSDRECTTNSCPQGGGRLCLADVYTGRYSCVQPKQLCESASSNECGDIDVQLATQTSTSGCAKRIDDATVLNIVPNPGYGDECVFGDVLDTKIPDGWQRADCFDEAAAGTCWVTNEENGRKLPNDCNLRRHDIPFFPDFNLSASSHLCTDRNRAIQGADAICIKHTTTGVFDCID